ncbi:hypothetical protein E4U53_005659 [Claviceps sorghi]|nr:hypothetical protein E4U53_005659 [Claviceps sorghi]
MECLETLFRAAPKSPHYTRSDPVQLTIPDSEAEDSTMEEEDLVELVQKPIFQVAEHSTALKSEAPEESNERFISKLQKKIQLLQAQKKKLQLAESAQDTEIQNLRDQIATFEKVFNSRKKEFARLLNENENLKTQKLRIQKNYKVLDTSYQEAQRKLRQGKTNADESAALANGTKVSDGEWRSQWKQLKCSIQNLVLLIEDEVSEARCPPLGKRFKRSSVGKGPRFSRHMFRDPNMRRWAVERYLWVLICDVVFDSKSRSDLDKAGRNYKIFNKAVLDDLHEQELIEHNSERLASYRKWFIDGWQITKPSESSIETMLQNDCGGIYELAYGNKQLKDGADELSIQNELREILSLAMTLDDMRMQSRAIITFHWHDLKPKKQGSDHAEFLEASMHAVNMNVDQKPSENARVHFIVTPALLKRGNANGSNYDSEMVLAKADVFMYREENQN